MQAPEFPDIVRVPTQRIARTNTHLEIDCFQRMCAHTNNLAHRCLSQPKSAPLYHQSNKSSSPAGSRQLESIHTDSVYCVQSVIVRLSGRTPSPAFIISHFCAVTTTGTLFCSSRHRDTDHISSIHSVFDRVPIYIW